MIEVSLHDGAALDGVTANYLDLWSVGIDYNFVPCLFSVRDKEQAFAFIREMKVLGAYGGKSECVLNDVHFVIVFTDGQNMLPSERRKLRGKVRAWVSGENAVVVNPFSAGRK